MNFYIRELLEPKLKKIRCVPFLNFIKSRCVPLLNILFGSISSIWFTNRGKDCKGWRSQFRSGAKEWSDSVTLKSLIFAKQKATLKIKIQNSTFVLIISNFLLLVFSFWIINVYNWSWKYSRCYSFPKDTKKLWLLI